MSALQTKTIICPVNEDNIRRNIPVSLGNAIKLEEGNFHINGLLDEAHLNDKNVVKIPLFHCN